MNQQNDDKNKMCFFFAPQQHQQHDRFMPIIIGICGHLACKHMLTCEASKNTTIPYINRLGAVHVDQQHCKKSSHWNGACNSNTQNKKRNEFDQCEQQLKKKVAGIPS